MKVTISFHHLEHTPSLDERIHEKSKKLEKFLDGKTHIKWKCYVKDRNQHADIELVGPHFEYHATAHSESLYKTIDMALGKIEKQLIKKKDIMKNNLHRHKEDPVCLDPEMAWTDKEDSEDVA